MVAYKEGYTKIYAKSKTWAVVWAKRYKCPIILYRWHYPKMNINDINEAKMRCCDTFGNMITFRQIMSMPGHWCMLVVGVKEEN